jgi:hypothetical protein
LFRRKGFARKWSWAIEGTIPAFAEVRIYNFPNIKPATLTRSVMIMMISVMLVTMKMTMKTVTMVMMISVRFL